MERLLRLRPSSSSAGFQCSSPRRKYGRVNGGPKYDELISCADLEGWGEAERDGLLSGDAEVSGSRRRRDFGTGDRDLGELGREGDGFWSE